LIERPGSLNVLEKTTMTITRERDYAPLPNGVITDKLTQSRADLQHLLEDDAQRDMSNEFPRSKTMKLLTSGKGVAVLAIAAGALLVFRPSVVTRVARAVPMSALLRSTTLRSLAMSFLSRR
jgi:hypothetical protein